jgi:tetratricopeptide (TPR) repeat protein
MIRRISSRLVWHAALIGVASVVVLGFALPAAAQGMITGTVVDAKGQPVVGAKVTIEQTDGVTRKFETKTDKKGEFIQIGLQSSSFKVTAEAKEGTATATTRVSQRGPSNVRLIVGGGAGNDPAVAAKTAELRKAFDDGVALSREGKFDESVESFNKAIALNPKCQDCFYNIGYAYAQKKDYAKAEENYKKALEVKPDYAEAYNGLANIYNAQRKFDQAAEASAKASQLSAAAPGALQGGNADSLYNEGVILWNGGKIADAKAKFQAAIAANPNHAESHYQLGMALVNEGKLKDAGDEFNAYLKLSPDGPNAATAKALIAQLPK